MNRWRERRRRLLQQELEAGGSPRTVFFFILLWAGIVAFLASLFLRHAGVTHMGTRYVLVAMIAYGVFFLLLWLWLRFRSDPVDGPDMSVLDVAGQARPRDPAAPVFRPGGGQSGGGGASGHFDTSATTESVISAKAETAGGATELAASAGEGLGLVLIAGLAMVAVFVWAVSIAPALLAELVLESFLLATLYRRWRRSDEPYRLMAVWRHTRIPFLVVLLLVGTVGTLLQWHAPHADTLGAVWSAR